MNYRNSCLKAVSNEKFYYYYYLMLALTSAYEFTYMYQRRSRKNCLQYCYSFSIWLTPTLPCQGHKKLLLPTQELRAYSGAAQRPDNFDSFRESRRRLCMYLFLKNIYTELNLFHYFDNSAKLCYA